MYRLFFVSLALAAISLPSFAQQDDDNPKGYHIGYVVTLKNDTIHGLMKHIQGSDKAKFKEVEDGKARVYRPADVLGFEVNGEVYRVRYSPKVSEPRFMRLVYTGYLTVYQIRYDFQQTTGGGPMGAPGMGGGYPVTVGGTKTKYVYYFQRERELFVTPLQGKFTKLAPPYLKDAPLVCAAIKAKELTIDDIVEVARRYNIETGHAPGKQELESLEEPKKNLLGF